MVDKAYLIILFFMIVIITIIFGVVAIPYKNTSLDMVMLQYHNTNKSEVVGFREGALQPVYRKPLSKSYNNVSLIGKRLFFSDYKGYGLFGIPLRGDKIYQSPIWFPDVRFKKIHYLRGARPTDIIRIGDFILVRLRWFKDDYFDSKTVESGFEVIDAKTGKWLDPILLDANFVTMRWSFSADKKTLYVGGLENSTVYASSFIYEIALKGNRLVCRRLLERKHQKFNSLVAAPGCLYIFSKTPFYEDIASLDHEVIYENYFNEDDPYFISRYDLKTHSIDLIGTYAYSTRLAIYDDEQHRVLLSGYRYLGEYDFSSKKITQLIDLDYVKDMQRVGDILYVNQSKKRHKSESDRIRQLIMLDFKTLEQLDSLEGEFGKMSLSYD